MSLINKLSYPFQANNQYIKQSAYLTKKKKKQQRTLNPKHMAMKQVRQENH